MFLSLVTRSTVLFQGWTTATVTGTALAVVLGALLSLALEFLKCYNAIQRISGHCCKSSCKRFSIPTRLLSSATHSVDMLMSYLLMLIVMTFNVYIFTAVIVGAGLGHFFFRPIFLRYLNARRCRQQSVLNTATRSTEEACQGCAGSSLVQDSQQTMESVGSPAKVNEEETIENAASESV